MNPRNFFAELKRRNVYKVAVAYAVVSWLIIQIATQVFPFFEVPNWAVRLVVLLLILGFPAALIFSWAFEITPEGIKRESEIEPSKSIARKTGRKLVAGTVVLAVIAASLFVFQFVRPRSTSPSVATISSKSIAVLPLANLSRDPDNEYFVAGMQDEIITRLAQISDLKVISCSSTQRYKGGGHSLRQVATELGVTNILEGSIQKANDQVHVNVQLLNAVTDSHLWADTFDRKLTDVFGVESEIAKTIADTLRAKLTGREAATLEARPTENNGAHDLYLKGRFFWKKRTSADMKTALGYFEQAANVDPNYAVAYAGMANCYLPLPLYGGGVPTEMYPKATAMAQKAIALDPNLGEPLASLGLIHALFDFDFATSVREFEETIRLNPNYATAHHW